MTTIASMNLERVHGLRIRYSQTLEVHRGTTVLESVKKISPL